MHEHEVMSIEQRGTRSRCIQVDVMRRRECVEGVCEGCVMKMCAEGERAQEDVCKAIACRVSSSVERVSTTMAC